MADVSRRARELGTENAFVVLAEVNQLVREGRDILSFCIGQPDFHTPVNVQDAAVEDHPRRQARLHTVGRDPRVASGGGPEHERVAARWAESSSPAIPTSTSPWPLQGPEGARCGRAGSRLRGRCCRWRTRWSGSRRRRPRTASRLFLHDLVDPMASLTLLSELMNYDFSGLALDTPITDELIDSVSGIRGLVQNIRPASAGGNGRPWPTWPATVPPCCRARASSGPVPRWPTRWRTGSLADACDGFVMAATHSPGAYEDVVRLVVPELQRRGCSGDRYRGATLRDNLGLARPGGSTWVRAEGSAPRAAGIDAATLVAGPLVATALGEFGAEVIKVEQPGTGDPLRTWGDRRGRHRAGLEERQPQQALRHPRSCARSRARTCSSAARHQRRARHGQSAQRPPPDGASTTADR